MAGIDLGSIIRDLSTLGQVQRQQTDQIAQTQMQQGEIGEQVARNLFEVAQRSERVENQALEAKLEAQNQSRRVARAGGMDASASNEIISGQMKQLRADSLAYSAASQQVQRMDEQGNLLANPLGWLNSILNGPEARATMEHTKERHQTSASQLNNMHALTQANVQTQNAIAETMTAASIKDQSRANALLAESKALQAQQDAMNYTVAGIDTLRQYGSEEFNRRLSVGSQVRAEQRHAQQMAMQQQQLEMRKKEMEMQMEGQQTWDEMARIYNGTLDRLDSEVKRLTGGEVKAHWGQNTPMGQRIMAAVDAGFMSEDTGSNIISRTPWDSLNMINAFGGKMPASLDQHSIRAFDEASRKLQEEVREARSFKTPGKATEHGLTMDNFENTDIQADIFNSVFSNSLQTQDANFESYELNLPIIKQEHPAIEQTEFYSKIVKPLEESGTAHPISTVAAQTAESFLNGEIDINEAVDGLHLMWRTQQDMFNATNGRESIGATEFVAVEPNLLAGEKSMPSGGAVGAQTGLMTFDLNRVTDLKSREIYERVDLTNPTAITTWLTKYRSNMLSRRMQEASGE
jgi:hypothetical protein